MEKVNKTGPYKSDPKNTRGKSGILGKATQRAKAESKNSQSARVTRHFQSGAINTVQGHQSVNGREGQSGKGARSSK